MSEESELKWRLVEDLTVRATYHNKLGLYYYHQQQGKNIEALKHFKAALWIAEQLRDNDGKVVYLSNIGNIYKIQGNYSAAQNCFNAIIKITKELGNREMEATYHNRIGLIHHEQGIQLKNAEQYKEALNQFKNAMKRYNTALKIAEDLGDQQKIVYLNNIAGIYNDQGNYIKALNQYEKALQILIDLGLEDSLDSKKIQKNIRYLKGKLMEKTSELKLSI